MVMGDILDTQKTELQRKVAHNLNHKPSQAQQDNSFFAPEKAGIKKGVLGGLIMMVIAVIWFFAGLSIGIVFFYPPILFVIGVYAFFKGIITGNVNGERDNPTKASTKDVQ